MLIPGSAAKAQSGGLVKPSIVHQVRSASERQEMTVNSSRILTLDNNIPQAQVNNPEILELTPLSPRQIQVFAKKPGVTQVNLWDENNQIYTVDVVVYGDASELTMVLKDAFPKASLHVRQVSNSVMISGFVEDPNDMASIVQVAEEFYPKVLNNMKIGGVHQVLLHVKVMEVSRTKMRTLGFDWAQISGGNVVASMGAGLIGAAGAGGVATTGAETFFFNVLSGGSEFFGVLEALRQNNLAKILAEPTLVTVSGRPAFFNSGGEFPVPVPQGLGTVAIEYRKYGTQVDFVPIVLGNGNIRLEVRPRVSEIDPSRSVEVMGTSVPGVRLREVDTGVEMMAGQTLAIAGLVQTRVESENRGIPWVSDVPYLGAMFRRVHEENNEVELLVLVTPELVEAVDADTLPPCGPGTQTASPTDWELYMRGYMEVPNCCPTGPMPNMTMPGDSGMIFDSRPEAVRQPAPAGSAPLPPVLQPSKSGSSNASRPLPPARSIDLSERQNRSNPQSRTVASPPTGKDGLPGFIGPIGYDATR
jgi:pilus assembly protein CpaC